jgi:hypothetical protein
MGGICGSAVLRAADALLRALGKDSVSLLLPATAMASDAAGQLGLVDPGVQEVMISPVMAREVRTGNPGPRRRIEFTLPASAIAAQLPSLGMGSAENLFSAVLGANHKGNLFHVESVVPESYSGTVCFYVVSCVE